jgi:hypothetical protein
MHICHICQERTKASQGNSFTTDTCSGSFWICKNCSPARERVFELETAMRRMMDRLVALQKVLEPEPWMTRLTDDAFKETYPGGLKGALGALTDLLWREA